MVGKKGVEGAVRRSGSRRGWLNSVFGRDGGGTGIRGQITKVLYGEEKKVISKTGEAERKGE